MADLREDFVQYVVKALVTHPDAVSLERLSDDKGEYLELHVDPSDMGKVIGKAGATAKSIRTLLRGVGAKDGLAPLPLKIVDPEGHVAEVTDAGVVADAETTTATEIEPEAPADTVEDEHQALRDRTKREMAELADLDL